MSWELCLLVLLYKDPDFSCIPLVILGIWFRKDLGQGDILRKPPLLCSYCKHLACHPFAQTLPESSFQTLTRVFPWNLHVQFQALNSSILCCSRPSWVSYIKSSSKEFHWLSFSQVLVEGSTLKGHIS